MIIFTAGEDIRAGDVVCVGDNGLLYTTHTQVLKRLAQNEEESLLSITAYVLKGESGVEGNVS